MKRIFMILALVCGILLHPSFGSAVKADDTSLKTEVRITDFTITRLDESTPNQYMWYDGFYIKMEWDASYYGNQLKENDYFDVKLPDHMRFPSNHAAREFPLLFPDGVTEAARAVVTPLDNGGGTIRVTFTRAVENRYDVKGTMKLEARFVHVAYDQKNTFEIQIGSKVKTIEVDIEGPKKLGEETLVKWGSAIKGSENKASWSIRINHKKRVITKILSCRMNFG